MKTKKYILDIPEPCHKKWDQMSPNEKGRFCQNCQTTVVDFSTKSNPEIAGIIKKTKGKICGHFRTEQLNKVIEAPRPMYHNFAFKAASVLMTGLLTTFPLYGQIPIAAIDKVEQLNTELRNKSITSCTIKGRLIDGESGEPIIYGNVWIKNIGIGIETDFDGYYTLKIPVAYLNTEIELEASYVGYTSTTKTIVTNQEELQVDFKIENDIIHLDEIVITGYVVPKVQNVLATRVGGLRIKETEVTVTNPKEKTLYQWVKRKNQVIQHNAEILNIDSEKKESSITSCIIKGKVIDGESGEPIIYGNVWIKGTETGAVTDVDGYYALKIPEAHLNKEIDIEFSYAGYTSTTKTIVAKQEEMNLSIELNASCYSYIEGSLDLSPMTIGQIAIRPKENTLYQAIKWKIQEFWYKADERQEKRAERKAKRLAKKQNKKNFTSPSETREQEQNPKTQTTVATIFPNPSSSDINITTNFDQAKKLDIGLFSLDGKLVYQQDQEVLKGTQTFSIKLNDRLPAVTYILRMNDGKNFLFSEQVILQKEN